MNLIWIPDISKSNVIKTDPFPWSHLVTEKDFDKVLSLQLLSTGHKGSSDFVAFSSKDVEDKCLRKQNVV